jgi:hypothetical protein
MLLDAGAIVDTETGEHGNALTVASWRGDEKVVKILLNAKTIDKKSSGIFFSKRISVS